MLLQIPTSGLTSERQTLAPDSSNLSAKALPSPCNVVITKWSLVDYRDDVDDDSEDEDEGYEAAAAEQRW